MSEENEIIGLARDVYDDAGKVIAKPTGELIALVPRAIKAAFCPLEKWILQKEYSVEETRKLLEAKLKNVPPENIQPPEAYIAIPTIQYISYCMDNIELRDMYANLLANSMNVVAKNGVHPGFVEIIKQLSPDEAKILRYLSVHRVAPTIILRAEDKNGEGIFVIKNFSNIGELCECEAPLNIGMYINNLVRLGLVDDFQGNSVLINEKVYEPLKTHTYVLEKKNEIINDNTKYNVAKIKKSYVRLTDYGRKFCDICITQS